MEWDYEVRRIRKGLCIMNEIKEGKLRSSKRKHVLCHTSSTIRFCVHTCRVTGLRCCATPLIRTECSEEASYRSRCDVRDTAELVSGNTYSMRSSATILPNLSTVSAYIYPFSSDNIQSEEVDFFKY